MKFSFTNYCSPIINDLITLISNLNKDNTILLNFPSFSINLLLLLLLLLLNIHDIFVQCFKFSDHVPLCLLERWDLIGQVPPVLLKFDDSVNQEDAKVSVNPRVIIARNTIPQHLTKYIATEKWDWYSSFKLQKQQQYSDSRCTQTSYLIIPSLPVQED